MKLCGKETERAAICQQAGDNRLGESDVPLHNESNENIHPNGELPGSNAPPEFTIHIHDSLWLTDV